MKSRLLDMAHRLFLLAFTFLSALISCLTPQVYPVLHPHSSLRGHMPPACLPLFTLYPLQLPCLFFPLGEVQLIHPSSTPYQSQSQPDSASSWALRSLRLRFAFPLLFSHSTYFSTYSIIVVIVNIFFLSAKCAPRLLCTCSSLHSTLIYIISIDLHNHFVG